MSSEVAVNPETMERLSTFEAKAGLLSWVASVDHKQIGIMYMITSLIFFLIGGIEAMLMRVQLAVPNNGFLSPHAYNQIFHHARHDHDFPGRRPHVDRTRHLFGAANDWRA